MKELTIFIATLNKINHALHDVSFYYYCYYSLVRLLKILNLVMKLVLNNFSINIEYSVSTLTCNTGTEYTCTPASTSSLACTRTGKIFEVPDACLDDGGINGVGDSLEIYCVCNRARFCLSGEACPWRNMEANITDDGRTYSRAGLTSPYMANAWCNLWQNYTNYNCCYDGFIGF